MILTDDELGEIIGSFFRKILGVSDEDVLTRSDLIKLAFLAKSLKVFSTEITVLFRFSSIEFSEFFKSYNILIAPSSPNSLSTSDRDLLVFFGLVAGLTFVFNFFGKGLSSAGKKQVKLQLKTFQHTDLSCPVWILCPQLIFWQNQLVSPRFLNRPQVCLVSI